MEPIVDVVIAVHSKTRPIARAVASVLSRNSIPVRVIVVAHNIDGAVIAENLGEWANDPRVELLHLADGVNSPAGPMNHGLQASTARFVSVMGSDDELEPGALDYWFSLHESTGAEIVIPQIRNDRGGRELSPMVRPFRSGSLDPVKDRLSYRSAPLGILSRTHFGHLRFAEGLRSGEDLPFVTRLWFSGVPIVFARNGPGYYVHSDADDRVTAAPRGIAEDFAFLDRIIGEPDIERLTARERRALVIKLIRVHLFDALINRPDHNSWPATEREALALVAQRMLSWAPGAERPLALLDRRILAGILDPRTPVQELLASARKRSNYVSPGALLTRNPRYLLHRQAPLRTYAAGYLL